MFQHLVDASADKVDKNGPFGVPRLGLIAESRINTIYRFNIRKYHVVPT